MSLIQQPTDGIISYNISIEGKDLPTDYQVLRIEVTQQANRISHAKVDIRDGCTSTANFTASGNALFNPGTKINIALGYQGKKDPVFSGIITKQSLEIDEQGTSCLQLECKHPAIKMTHVRNNTCHYKAKDSKIIQTITEKYNLATKIESTQVIHPQMVQYYATDWDFILTRAQANGLVVFTEGDKLEINKPQTTANPVIKLTYGTNLLGFHAELNSDQQYPQILSRSWQPDQQKILEVKANTPETTKTGDLSSKQIASAVKTKPFVLQHGAELSKENMQSWADAHWQNTAMSSINGSVSIQGIAKVKPGDIVELAGVSKHFNGAVWVNCVEHKLTQGNWITSIAFGMSGLWFGHKPDVHMPINNGLLPAIQGLQIGIVTKIDEDPESAYRVRVRLPLIDNDNQGLWARLGCNYAGKEYGCFFLPELGDEVILGFLDNDPRSPIILSSLYSKKYPPAAEGTSDKPQKYIITKNKLKLCFDDEKKIIQIETPGGCQFELNDDKKFILIKDKHENQWKLSDQGIDLISKKNISLVSEGDIKLSAKNINLEAKADIKAEATNIQQTAKSQCKIEATNIQNSAKGEFKAEAKVTAELSATGNTTIKGAMVMIN